jgi:hypothetical protein
MRNINTKQLKIRYFLLVFFLGISVASAFAQVKITGTVTDASNQSTIPGVSIAVKGTTSGTMTDIDGKYALEVDNKAILVFSFIGFTPQEIPVQGRSIIDVSLLPEAQLLDQLIVTGYSSQKKVDVTGAISVVEMKKIASASLSSGNVMQALQGNVPGLYVTKSGNPSGASDQILIRGVNTLGDTHPLYIIDGMPTTRAEVFAALNRLITGINPICLFLPKIKIIIPFYRKNFKEIYRFNSRNFVDEFNVSINFDCIRSDQVSEGVLL